MEIQFRITEGKPSAEGFSLEITVMLATEMGEQPLVLEMENKSIPISEMEK